MPKLLIALVLAGTVLTAGCKSGTDGEDGDNGGEGGGGKAGGGGSPSGGQGGNGGGGKGGEQAAGGGGGSGGGSATGGSGGSGGGGGSAGSGAGGSTGSGTGGSAGGNQPDAGADDKSMSFFVTSTGNPTGNLGGLAGADKKCQDLATAVGVGGKTWRAYLSAANNGTPIHAKDRIGKGPWYNQKGVMVAKDLAALHALDGNADLFLDEKGVKVPGQWQGSPQPNVHDILTGTKRDGTLYMGGTCNDWTSTASNMSARVGHSDGRGPGGSDAAMYLPWNEVHDNESCANTAPRGGGGRFYCFAAN